MVTTKLQLQSTTSTRWEEEQVSITIDPARYLLLLELPLTTELLAVFSPSSTPRKHHRGRLK